MAYTSKGFNFFNFGANLDCRVTFLGRYFARSPVIRRNYPQPSRPGIRRVVSRMFREYCGEVWGMLRRCFGDDSSHPLLKGEGTPMKIALFNIFDFLCLKRISLKTMAYSHFTATAPPPSSPPRRGASDHICIKNLGTLPL